MTHYSIALLVEQCSLPSDLSSRNLIKEIPVAHEGLACGLDAIFALHNYACSIAIGVVSISCLELSGSRSGSPSVSFFSSVVHGPKGKFGRF